jgi:hypothetical protein
MHRLFALLSFLLCALTLCAQVTGRVIDDETGQPVPRATLQYKGTTEGTKADANGNFTLPRHEKQRLVVSSVGYVTKEITIRHNSVGNITVKLKPDAHTLQEVTVTSRRSSRYRRKDNPAVELMRKVIEARKRTDLRQKDYCRYSNYQKIVAGLNDLKPSDFESGLLHKPWILDHVELCPYTNKLILPISLEETVTERFMRRDPHLDETTQKAHRVSGVTRFFQSGDIINQVMKEYFTDVDIYQDNIRLLRHPFTSPIGRDAILFYHFYITDTTYVDGDRCYQLDFTPATMQDFGFRGQLFVMADSSYLVKRCDLKLPNVTGVNWVEGLYCTQQFGRLDTGDWVLLKDDMVAEMAVTDFITKLIVIRNTVRSHFDFSEFDEYVKTDETYKPHLSQSDVPYTTQEMLSDENFLWDEYRQAPLSQTESSLDLLVKRIENLSGFKYVLTAIKALFENYIETGTEDHPSKFDIGPVLSTISSNFHDGLRLRIGGQTTANLHPHIFFNGYYAHAMKSKENYYDATLTYAFGHPKYLPHEFPARTISLKSRRDVALPSDKYLDTDKDNVFSAVKISEIDKMLLYNSQSLAFEYEQKPGIRLTAEMKTEKINPIGNIAFTPLSSTAVPAASSPESAAVHDASPLGSPAAVPSASPLGSLRYTEATLALRFSPGETVLQTKQRRRTLHYDTPVVRLQHTTGIKGLLGGQYNYNYTELEMWKRFWLPMSFGYVKARLRLGAQWNQVPFPLLIMPEANMAYFIKSNSFDLINNMEFLNDRFASLQAEWDLNGKLFNLVPLLKELKWREHLAVHCLWGSLTNKNNPYLPQNAGSELLMAFPEGSYVMDHTRPYWEVCVGVHNIFKLLKIEYIRRLNYLELPTAKKQVIKMAVEFKF